MTDRLDDAIDRAVRDMLDVEPRADLRARVIAQLPEAGSRLPAGGSRLRVSSFRLMAPVGAAALIVFAVFIARRSEPIAPSAPVVAHRGDLHLPMATPEVAPSTPSPSATIPPAAAPVRGGLRAPGASMRTPRTVVAVSFDSGDDQTTAIEPLKTITPISIAPIAQDSIAPAEIPMHPLNPLSELQIAPLTPRDRRN